MRLVGAMPASKWPKHLILPSRRSVVAGLPRSWQRTPSAATRRSDAVSPSRSAIAAAWSGARG